MLSSRRDRVVAVLAALASVATLAGCAATTLSAGTDDAPPAGAILDTTVTGQTLPDAPPTVSGSYAAPAVDTPAIRIVTIGDSLMSGYGLEPDDAWPRIISVDSGASIVNLACAGMGFAAVGDCGTDYAGMIPAAMALAPDVVIIQSSDNDMYDDAEDLQAATTQAIGQLRAALPDARILCLSTLWSDEDVPGDVQMTTDALAVAAAESGCEFVDVGQPLAGHPEWYQADDEHPNADGQRVLAAALAASIASVGVLPAMAG